MAIRRTGSQTLVNRGVTAAAATPVNIITGSGGGGATVNISSIQIANSTFVAKDDTAIDTAGGYLIINGTGFQSGAVVYIQGTAATSTSFVSSSRLNVTVPALSSGLLDVYVVNTDGSGSIYLRSLNANGTPSWTTTSPLTSQDDGTAFAINLVATGAAGDGTITYAVSSGSTLPSGTFLASNGYFYGTVSGIQTETTYSFSVDAIDAQNQETARSFNITVRAGDQYLKNTVLLLNGETSNNTWITDTSTNNFAVTVNGDTRPVAFSPYETVWSNYFDGTGDYLTVPSNAAFQFGTGDFTVEMWVYITANPGTYAYIYGQGPNSSASMSLYIQGGVFNLWNGSAVISGSTSYSLNRWYHVAISRSGTSLRLFLNGVQEGSATNSSNITTGSSFGVSIGRWAEIGDTGYFTGYISNVRVLKGTALYTSPFTAPTSPLTAITNTSLLTCQSNRLIDNSTNNFTITKNGDVTVSNFGPFVETDITTGSGYFDGTGDFLELTDSSNLLDIGGAVASIECWYYPTAQPAYGILISKGGGAASWSTSNGFEYQLSYTSGTFTIYFNNAGNSGSIQNTTTSPLNQWYHLVVATDASNNLSLFVNGTRVATTTNAITKPTTRTSVRIGNDVSASHPSGYITDMRVIVGTGAYSASSTTLTVPTSSLTPITNTRLLTLQSRIGENNNRFIDTSGINNIITRNGNATQGTFSPFQRGGWSNYFDGTGDFFNITYNTAFDLTQGDFTVEAWVYRNVAGSAHNIFSNRSDAPSKGWEFRINSTNTIQIFYTGGSSVTSTGTVPANAWTHIAASRSGTTVRLFINGTLDSSATFSNGTTSTNVFKIGADNTNASIMNGYISNARVVKGTAVYTSAFTPPTLPLTAIANTSLLTCADNGFIDKSPNNFTITRNGDVSVQSFSPFRTYTYTANTHSVYFDGTGDYLTIPSSSAFGFGTGDFTIEFWAFMQSRPNTWRTFFDMGVYTTGILMRDQVTPDSLYIAGTSYDWMPNTYLALNQWNHVALTRSGTTLRVFVNGTAVLTTTNSSNLTSPLNFFIGESQHASGQTWPGYISNFRVVKGVAVYTGNFAVPNVGPLQLSGTLSANAYSSTTNVNTTFAAANTSLLTCASNTIIDLSTANTNSLAHTITVNGDARATTINPLGFTVANSSGTSADYSITNEGGSMFFDGNGDFLKLDTTNILTWSGTTTFTVEGWFYQTAFDATSGFMNNVIGDLTPNSSFGDALYWSIGMNNSNQPGIRWYGGPTTCNATEALTLYRWNHVAWVVSSGVLSIYINGKKATLSGTSTLTAAASSMSYVVVGADRGKYYSGYMSGLRVVKGTALYTSGFVPPAAPQLPIVGTTLLVNGTNGSIIDYTRKNNLETVGDVKIRNNITKFGNTSIYFDGTGDYIYQPSSINYGYGTGNFTIEFWLYLNSTGLQTILSHLTSNPQVKPHIYYSSGVRLYVNGSDVITGGTVTISTWTHIAIVRNSGSTRLYINGTQSGSTYTDSNDYGSASPLIIAEYGVPVSGTNQLNAYIDDLRITKGVARYTSNFSVPNKHPTN